MARKPATKRRSSKAAPKRPGRPAGSLTAHIEPVRVIRATCRKCGSSDLKRHRVINDVAHVEHTPAGDTTRRRWTRCSCQKCRVWQIVIEDYNP